MDKIASINKYLQSKCLLYACLAYVINKDVAAMSSWVGVGYRLKVLIDYNKLI